MITVNNHSVYISHEYGNGPELVVKNEVGEITDTFPIFGSVEMTSLDGYGPCLVWAREKRIRPFTITRVGMVKTNKHDIFVDVMPD